MDLFLLLSCWINCLRTGSAAEARWASLAGQSVCWWAHHREERIKQALRAEWLFLILVCPASPPPATPEVKYCSLYGNSRAGEAVPSYRWQNWGSESLVVSGLNCLPALRVDDSWLVIPFDRKDRSPHYRFHILRIPHFKYQSLGRLTTVKIHRLLDSLLL